MKKIIATTISIILFCISYGQWSPINGPGGKDINFIEKQGDVISVLLQRVDRFSEDYYSPIISYSIDGGTTWDYRNINPVHLDFTGDITGLVIKDSTYFTGTWSNGILKTFLYEGEWLTVSAGLKDRYVSVLKSDGNKIYAGLDSFSDDYEWGVYTTEAEGANWELSLTKKVNDIQIIDNTIYAGGYNGIHYSNDSGKTWDELSENLSSYISEILKFSICGDRILVKGHKKIIISNDYGVTWVELENNEEWEAINSLQVTNENLILATDNGLYLSKDNGTIWERKSFSMNNQKFYTIEYINDTLYIGGNNGKLIYSIDDGKNWNNYGNPIPYIAIIDMINCGKNILTSTSEGILISDNDGASWKIIDYDFEYGISKFATDGDRTVFAISRNGKVYVSDDNGNTWLQINNAFDEENESAIINMSYINNNLIVATRNLIHWSENKGATWRQLHWHGIDNIYSMYHYKNKIYVAIRYEGIYEYDFTIHEWKLLDSSFDNLDWGFPGAYMGMQDNRMFITYENDLYATSLDKINWVKVNDTSVWVLFPFNINDEEILYVANSSNISLIKESKWYDFRDGMPDMLFITDRVIYNNDYFFANIPSYGIWKRHLSINPSNIAEKQQTDNFHFYPNPSDDYISFTWTDNISKMTLTIFNTNGVKMLNKIITKNEAINISDLKKGLYYFNIYDDTNKIYQTDKILVY